MTYTPKLQQRINVTNAQQLAGTLSSDIDYFIDGSIDMGTVQITIPSGGLTLSGYNFFVSKLFSTENNYTMFNNGSAGNVLFKNIEFSVSGTSSQLFDVDNNGNSASFELLDCNIGSFDRVTTSFGSVSNYRQLRFAGCGFINYSDGFTLNGTFSGGLAVTDSIILSAQSGSTLFNEGTSLVLQGSSTSNINAASALNAANSVVWDFQESNILNDAQFVLDGARFGSLTAPVPNLAETSTKAFYRDCVGDGITNTRPGYEMEFSTQAVTPLTADTPAKANGTTTTSNAVWWNQTNNNEVTYLSSETKDFKITVNTTVDGGANDEIALIVRQWDNSTSTYIDLKTRVRNISNVLGGLDVANYSFVTRGEFSLNDRIELWIENTTDGTDATILDRSSEIFVEVI